MKFTTIIPTYKRRDELFKCLNCLAHYFTPRMQEMLGFTVEVLVSDDAREVDLEEVLAKRFPWCRYIEGPSRGPAANRNNGARHATGQWLIFTDDDCLPQHGWIEAFNEKIKIANILEGKTIAERPRQRLDEEAPVNESGGLLWSCNFAIKREIFTSFGGFDETFPFAAMEDIEFRHRLSQNESHTVFIENAIVTHPWRRISDSTKWKRQYESVMHMVKLHPGYKKNYRPQIILRRALSQFKILFSPFALKCRYRGASAVLRQMSFTFRLLRFSIFSIRSRPW